MSNGHHTELTSVQSSGANPSGMLFRWQVRRDLHPQFKTNEDGFLAFAFFNYTSGSQPQVVFIYACPLSSPIKHRMLYSAGAASVFSTAKSLLPPGRLGPRKLETSDPSELGSKFFNDELGAASASTSRTGTPGAGSGGGFARPKGPARRTQ